MNDFDRFTEFLRREGAGYHDPPETPAEVMWPGVEGRLGAADAGPAGDTAPYPLRALGYNEPPPAPRDEMWKRIEAAWALRRSADPAEEEGAALEVAGRAARSRRWTKQGGAVGWAVSLAAAASLVLGLALGRGTRPPQPGETAVTPAVPATEDEPRPAPPSARPIMAEATPATADPYDPPPVTDTRGFDLVASSTPPERPYLAPNLRDVADDYTTTRHLGRASTLLTAFRTDQGTPASQRDLAGWARDLLGDTRGLLDMSVGRSPLEYALLEDLELVLVQIASLGPGAPDFERQLAWEGMAWQGTLMRLRSASAAGET